MAIIPLPLFATVRVTALTLLTVGAMLAALGALAATFTTAPWVDWVVLSAILLGLGSFLCFAIAFVARRARDRWPPSRR